MGFLDRLKASQSTQIGKWQSLDSIAKLDEIDKLSAEKPVVIFKHSTTCGISASAKNRIEFEWDKIEGDFEFYYLDLLTYRSISNAIADRYGIRHESPQILVIKNGVATFDSSHYAIQASAISEAIG